MEDIYNPGEEPLLNPEKEFKLAIEDLKSGDWNKQFSACNTVKRVAMFHRELITTCFIS